MNWDKMTEICTLHNQGKEKECIDLIASDLEAIDNEQAIDFVTNCITLTDEAFALSPENYEKLYLYLDKKESPNMRCAIRLGRLQQLVEERQKELRTTQGLAATPVSQAPTQMPNEK